MVSLSNKKLITRTLERAKTDFLFVAHKLAAYAANHAVDEAAVATFLRCDSDGLVRLALCRAPQGDGFAVDVRRIAAFAPCDAEALAQLLREVDAVIALRHDSRVTVPMAARDRFESDAGVEGDDCG